MARKRKFSNLGQKSAKRRYWLEEERRYRKEQPLAYSESRARERVANAVLKPMNAWRKNRQKALDNWMELENFLLSGKKDQAKFLKMIANARDRSKKAMDFEKNFLQARANASVEILDEADWNAIERFLAMKDKMAEMNLEINKSLRDLTVLGEPYLDVERPELRARLL